MTDNQGLSQHTWGGEPMDWKTMLAYVTGSVDENLLLRIEYLAAENRILRDQIKRSNTLIPLSTTHR
jgi:hypothetical protein